MTISPRENFYRMMSGDGPRRLPFFMNFTPPVCDEIRRRLGDVDPTDAFGLHFSPIGVAGPSNGDAWRRAYRQLGVDLPAKANVGYCGITHLDPPRESVGEAYHLSQLLHPLAGASRIEQLQSLPWSGVAPRDQAELSAHVERTHALGLVAVAAMECTVFETAWYLRGMENLLIDLVEGNGISDWLLDRITERSIANARAACAAGFDVIGLGDDVGTQRGLMMSVDFWRKHLRPRLARVIDAIRAAQRRKIIIRYHSDGDVRPILEDLIEIGVDAINPVQPECMPPAEVIPRFRGRVAFWGMVGTQTTMPFGTPADVERVVAACAAHARDGAAIIVAPTHVIEPDVPWENLVALAAAVAKVELS